MVCKHNPVSSASGVPRVRRPCCANTVPFQLREVSLPVRAVPARFAKQRSGSLSALISDGLRGSPSERELRCGTRERPNLRKPLMANPAPVRIRTMFSFQHCASRLRVAGASPLATEVVLLARARQLSRSFRSAELLFLNRRGGLTDLLFSVASVVPGVLGLDARQRSHSVLPRGARLGGRCSPH